ncbi:MAG: Malonyl-(acyl-carrier protein) O-methyltransferase [Syntrophomonadaceae bacterium]|nr:Malonyl-(acyl-carrier protein) O-methyltransferase [Bacillota bacterium]
MERSQKNEFMMNEGIRVAERDLCLLCDNKGTPLYQDLRDRLFSAPGTWMLLRCSKCGLVWLNPQPIPEDIGKLYCNYFTHDPSPETLKAEPAKSWRKAVNLGILNAAFGYKNDRANKTLGWLASRIGPLRDIVEGSVMWLNDSRPGKLLDVGCGNGQFLATMRELGWEVTGVEPDGQAAKVARERGLNVYEGVLEEITLPDDTFDAITMSHVVEHLPDPIGTFGECKRILKKGGRLVVTVPNIESLGHRLYREACLNLDPPRHLFLFSPHTLRTCLERSGLQVLELRTTARTARWMWAASCLIKRSGALPSGSPQNLRPGLRLGLRLGGLMFQIVEHMTCWAKKDAGEEVVLIAGKEANV